MRLLKKVLTSALRYSVAVVVAAGFLLAFSALSLLGFVFGDTRKSP